MSPNLPHPILKRLQIVPTVIPAFTIIYEIAHLISVSSGSRTNNVFATSTIQYTGISVMGILVCHIYK